MARGTTQVATEVEGPAVGRLARVPVRRAIQWVLGVGILVGAVYAAYRTLSLGLFSASAWRDLVVFGVAQGAIYALIALGYTMVYGILRMINFAHGEVFMWGAFVSYFVARTLENSGFMESSPYIAILILLVFAMAGSIGVAGLLDRPAYPPPPTAPPPGPPRSRGSSRAPPPGPCGVPPPWSPWSRPSVPHCSPRTLHVGSSGHRP